MQRVRVKVGVIIFHWKPYILKTTRKVAHNHIMIKLINIVTLHNSYIYIYIYILKCVLKTQVKLPRGIHFLSQLQTIRVLASKEIEEF